MHGIAKGSIDDCVDEWVSRDSVRIVNDLIYQYNYAKKYPERLDFILTRVYNRYTLKRRPEALKQLFEVIISNTPIGYELSAGIVTNYLQLKGMYRQRKDHKMSFWSIDFKRWVEDLPFSYLITGK